MARLHEYQGKSVLSSHGTEIPRGTVLTDPSEIDNIPSYPVVLKAQAWTTSRKKSGLIQTARSGVEAHRAAAGLLSRTVKGFPVQEVLAEEFLEIEQEFFFSYFLDDEIGVPRYVVASVGGSGIEEILRLNPDAMKGDYLEPGRPVYRFRVYEVVRSAGLTGPDLIGVSGVVYGALLAARAVEARSLEINPIVKTVDGRYLAADCRLTVDDYAVFRHPELNIEIARELANLPTELDRIAYRVEQNDYRGTFYFIQLEEPEDGSDRLVGFHGAGGGGSMMSMDALQREGFTAANFCDTSGNPPASKVYRAARIIAAQDGIVGYFGSGSGVASQEQIHTARGLVKAFNEIGMDVPVVVRLGGNLEDEAVSTLEEYTTGVQAPIRGFTKDAPVADCVRTLKDLIATYTPGTSRRKTSVTPPEWTRDQETYSFESPTGTVHYHHPTCLTCETQACVSGCVPQILKIENGVPVLAISRPEAKKGKCIECLACQIECERHGAGGGYVQIPVTGLDDAGEDDGRVV